MEEITTADGRGVRTGDRVFNYYDGWWGRITGPIDRDGWFDLVSDDGARRNTLNGERVAVRLPRGNPFYNEWVDGLDDVATRNR